MELLQDHIRWESRLASRPRSTRHSYRAHALLRLRLATNGSPAYGDCSGECHGDGAVATRTFAMTPTNTLQFEGCRRTIIAARTEA